MAKQTRKPRRPSRKETNVKDLKVKSYDNESSSKLPHNDPEWYIYDKEMFEGVISMPTLEFKGKAVPWNSNAVFKEDTPAMEKMSKLKDVPFSTPTVAAYLMNPGLEFCSDTYYLNSTKYNAINVAARKMYAELSASNAKTSLYAPQDIATLILALGQVIAMISHLKRMYGIANHFNFYSRRVPSDLFDAMYVDGYGTLAVNLADFRNKVNQLIARIDTIQFPTGLTYFKKCEYVYQNVFVDRDEKMVSYHLMAPFTTWKINEEKYSEGTVLETKSCTQRTYNSVRLLVEDMIEAILTSSTFNTIFADIINLSNRNVLTTESLNIDMIPIDYTITPIYSEQFNWQVMNMSIMPFPNNETYSDKFTPYNDVYPDVDKNILLYAPMYKGPSTDVGVYEVANWAKIPPIRLPDTNPSQDMFVELLAYTCIPRVESYVASGNQVNSVYLDNVSDFWCSLARVVRPSDYGNNASVVTNLFANCTRYTDWYSIAAASQFVHFPFMAAIDVIGADTWMLPISRLSAYTQVNVNALRNLRYQTYLGLFSFKR